MHGHDTRTTKYDLSVKTCKTRMESGLCTRFSLFYSCLFSCCPVLKDNFPLFRPPFLTCLPLGENRNGSSGYVITPADFAVQETGIGKSGTSSYILCQTEEQHRSFFS